MTFRDYNGEPIVEGFYFKEQPTEIFAIGNVTETSFTTLSDRFPHAFIVPEGILRGDEDKEWAYQEFAGELTRISDNSSLLDRPSVSSMRQTLRERLAAA